MDALFPVGTSGIVHTERVNYLVGSPAAGPTYVGAIQRYVLGSGFNLDPNNAVFCVFPGNLEDLTNVLVPHLVSVPATLRSSLLRETLPAVWGEGYTSEQGMPERGALYIWYFFLDPVAPAYALSSVRSVGEFTLAIR